VTGGARRPLSGKGPGIGGNGAKPNRKRAAVECHFGAMGRFDIIVYAVETGDRVIGATTISKTEYLSGVAADFIVCNGPGALVQFPTLWIIPLALVYAVLRGGAKIAGVSAMTHIGTLPFPTPKLLGLGLIPQGGISLVMALSALLTFYGLELGGVDVSQWLFSVVVLGVVLSELVGPTLTMGTLRRAGEISPLVEKALALGDDEGARAEAARHRPEIPDDSDDVSSDDADDVQRGTRTSTS